MKGGFLVLMVVICFGAAAVGGMATAAGVGDWYPTLAKPSWNPPGWVFGPVWSALYLAMAVAAWWVCLKAGSFKNAAVPLSFFAIQLGLNVLWSFVFFAWQQPGWAFVEIVVLWLAILVTMVAFFARSRLAGGLIVPYLAWVSFAAFLNWTIWRLNA
jgi:tryptophan-rich sensory protein